jgi:hypothetical protein
MGGALRSAWGPSRRATGAARFARSEADPFCFCCCVVHVQVTFDKELLMMPGDKDVLVTLVE